jgi:hypothetical protein
MFHFEPAGVCPLTHTFGVELAMQQDSHRHAAVRGIRRVLKMRCIFK